MGDLPKVTFRRPACIGGSLIPGQGIRLFPGWQCLVQQWHDASWSAPLTGCCC